MKTSEVLAELRRELGMRRSLYPSWIQSKKIAAATADHRIEAIERAIELIEAVAEPEEGAIEQFTLFK